MLKSWKQLAAIGEARVHCRSLVSEIKSRKQQKSAGKMLERLKQVMAVDKPVEKVVADDNDLDSKGKRRKKKVDSSHELKISDKIQTYFNENDHGNMLKAFPESLLRIKRNPDISLYLASEGSARIIADVLTKNLQKEKPLLEINPGLGLLTKLLINETENDLLLYESEPHFHPELKVSIEHSAPSQPSTINLVLEFVNSGK